MGQARPDDWYWDKTLKLTPRPDGRYTLVYTGIYRGLEAGEQREDIRGKPLSELAKDRQGAYIDSWGVDLAVDSVTVDSADTVDSVFTENIFGVITLSTQKVGKATIITLPALTFLRKTIPTAMVVNGTRDYPVDLHNMVMRAHRTVELTIPAEYGEPNLLPPLALTEQSLAFGSTQTWDKAARRLTITYDIEIKDGAIGLEPFIALIKAVNERFDTPILLEKI
jgi:hypothetical protein